MRTLLITGGAGFVGRYLIAAAENQGFAVTALGRGARPRWLPHSAEWARINLHSRSEIATLPTSWSAVIHLAANSIPRNYIDEASVKAEVDMTRGLTDHIRSGRFMFVSSCHVYGNSTERHLENEPLKPNGRYGEAKMLCENVAMSASHLDPIIARPFNHIGKGMPIELAVPAIIKRIGNTANGAGIDLLGQDSIRDFVDVRDIVSAYIDLVLAKTLGNRVFNICSGNPTSMRHFTAQVLQVMGRSEQIRFAAKPRSGDDVDYIVGNNDRMREATGWVPKISLPDSIRDVMAGDP